MKVKLAALASEGGFSVEELFGGKTNGSKANGTKARGKVAPKYCNPADASQHWSGRGRQPLWFVAALKKGIKPEKLLIK